MKTFLKTIILTLMVAVILPFNTNAQDKVEFENLKVKVLMPENEQVSEALLSSFQDRLYEAVTLNALGSTDESSRFVILPVVNIVSKNATASIPPQFVAEVEIALYFADVHSKTILSQAVIVKKAMDDTDVKAVAKALKSVQARDKKIKRMFDEGKQNLATYISTHPNENLTDSVKDVDTKWILNN